MRLSSAVCITSSAMYVTSVARAPRISAKYFQHFLDLLLRHACIHVLDAFTECMSTCRNYIFPAPLINISDYQISCLRINTSQHGPPQHGSPGTLPVTRPSTGPPPPNTHTQLSKPRQPAFGQKHKERRALLNRND